MNPFSECLTTAVNLGSDISWYGFTRYSSSRDRVVLELFFPRVYDFFQYSRLPIKSADVSAQDLSAALKMILFRRLRIVTSALSRDPSTGKKEVFDWAAMIVVQFACRITSTLQSESEMKRCASSCQQIRRLSSSGRRFPGGLGSNRRSAWA